MKIVPVHGKYVYRKGLIVQNWRHIKCKFMTETCRKQIQIGLVEHLENCIRYQLIQCPLCFDYLSILDNLSAKTFNLPGI